MEKNKRRLKQNIAVIQPAFIWASLSMLFTISQQKWSHPSDLIGKSHCYEASTSTKVSLFCSELAMCYSLLNTMNIYILPLREIQNCFAVAASFRTFILFPISSLSIFSDCESVLPVASVTVRSWFLDWCLRYLSGKKPTFSLILLFNIMRNWKMNCGIDKSHFRKSFVPCKGYCLLLPVVLSWIITRII